MLPDFDWTIWNGETLNNTGTVVLRLYYVSIQHNKPTPLRISWGRYQITRLYPLVDFLLYLRYNIYSTFYDWSSCVKFFCAREECSYFNYSMELEKYRRCNTSCHQQKGSEIDSTELWQVHFPVVTQPSIASRFHWVKSTYAEGFKFFLMCVSANHTPPLEYIVTTFLKLLSYVIIFGEATLHMP